ncbi:MAG TPA: hypothetical protein VHH88_11830 [Verrucomicrobiae bacterium]|nr:hypothetical protein [Verrucomicrobiae bacterium]
MAPCLVPSAAFSTLAKSASGGYQHVMKKLLLAMLGFACAFGTVRAAETDATNSIPTITADQAKDHEDMKVTVSGTIAEVNVAEKIVRLNFEKPYPKQPFTAVVFASRTNVFPDLEQLKGKKVEVTGKITTYHNHPQIIMNSTNQLKVIEQEAK